MTGVPVEGGPILNGGEAKGPDGTPYNHWAAAMQSGYHDQSYYKTAAAAHPAGYYGAPMGAAHPAYMWGGQAVMPPYGAPPPAAYYGGMYPPPGSYGYGLPSMDMSRPKAAGGNGEDGLVQPMNPVTSPVQPGVPMLRNNTDSGSDGSSASDSAEGLRSSKRSFDAMDGSGAAGAVSGAYAYPAPQAQAGAAEMWPMAAAAGRAGAAALGEDGGAIRPKFQDEREVKRQRRKQSNRESARRSRLRKQAECDDLGTRVNTLTMENMALRTELARIQEKCSGLQQDNTALFDQVKSAGLTPVVLLRKENNNGAHTQGEKDSQAAQSNKGEAGQGGWGKESKPQAEPSYTQAEQNQAQRSEGRRNEGGDKSGGTV